MQSWLSGIFSSKARDTGGLVAYMDAGKGREQDAVSFVQSMLCKRLPHPAGDSPPNHTQMVSLNRVQKAVKSVIGTAISEVTVLRYIHQLHQSLQQWKQSAVEYLLSQPVIHVDETSMRVDGKNQWVHVYFAGQVALKVVHPIRGKEAMEAIGIIPRYDNYIIHDCLRTGFLFHLNDAKVANGFTDHGGLSVYFRPK